MSILDPKSLESSPLADLHLLASELGLDGYRRLRKADLISAIIARQSGEEGSAQEPAVDDAGPAVDAPPSSEAGDETEGAATPQDAADVVAPEAGEPGEIEPAEEAPAVEAVEPPAEGDEETGRRSRRGRRGSRSRPRGRDDEGEVREPADEAATAEAGNATADGIVELMPNGSAFLRVSADDESQPDVYISAGQVKRCELVSGDRVSGPVRRPRQSERYPSLVRIDTINGRAADEVAEGTRFEDRPVAFPDQRLTLGVEDPTVRAIEWLTPFGRGSRLTISAPARGGKTEALRRVAAALAAQGEVELIVALTGVRPEEVAEWSTNGLPAPVAVVPLGGSPDAQAQAVDQAVEQGRRVAGRGGDAVVVIDSLAHLPIAAARRVMGMARNLVDGGSLTVLATALEPVGGETTVVCLDATLTAMNRFPALDLARSGTMRPERLVGEEGAEAIGRARAEALAD